MFKTSLRFVNRQRYAKAVKIFLNNSDKYELLNHGKDYSADVKNKIVGCGWYIEYLIK